MATAAWMAHIKNNFCELKGPCKHSIFFFVMVLIIAVVELWERWHTQVNIPKFCIMNAAYNVDMKHEKVKN